MELARAYAILGVEQDTPLEKVRQRYRMRAQMLHPDRHTTSSVLREEAEQAMGELNRAWETVQQADRGNARQERRAEQESQPEPPEADWRLPATGECDMCGCAPAQSLTLHRIVGLVIFWKHHRVTWELCRNCAISTFREAQSKSLAEGWWGAIAPVANITALCRNLITFSGIKRMPPPETRADDVVSPIPPGVFMVTPVLQRPAPWLATIGASMLAVGIIGGSIESNSPTSDPTIPASVQSDGVCLTEDGWETDSCDAPDAAWQITGEATTWYDCSSSEARFESEDGRIFCARRLG